MHSNVDRTLGTRPDKGDGSVKKPYHAPRMEDYGSVVELTGTGGGTVEDSGGPSFDFSGAAA